MSAIRDIIQSYMPVSMAAVAAIEKLAVPISIKKGEVFIHRNQSDSKEYFVLDGVCRSFLLDPEGEEVTISFFDKGAVLSPHTTRTSEGRSTLNFQACTDIELAGLDSGGFENLMVNDLEIREFGNRVLRHELGLKVQKEIGLASLTAKQRLIEFREHFPLLENLVPHHAIATFLGITTISLSRLRKDLMD